MNYRLTKNQKSDIAQNLLDVLISDVEITHQTRGFISNWILTGPSEKSKAFFDVWDIVLKNYLPTTRPILFRASDRVGKNGSIASFTGRLECARRMYDQKGVLIIYDTNEALQFEGESFQVGQYKNTFYPLVDVLVKARNSGGSGFSDFILNYIGEDEYITRLNLEHMHTLRWTKSDS